ncbi:glycosyltransferase [Marimonas sp. MJW-29]|uniref:Glycosyltransferase n=1 Tax=Sulfitobacter sediminis TaxID=3234186 RepID=A0ABV3RG89_9RHOB
MLGHFDKRHLPEGLVSQIESVKFTGYQKYLETLRRADSAVMPLCDDIFNRCKSAVRVLDAAAVGVPSIVGGVGDLAQVVRDGDTGHIVRSTEGWLEALRALAEDPLGARRMGRAARDDLDRRWAASDASHIFAPELIDWVEG